MPLIDPVLGTPAVVPSLDGYGYFEFPESQPFSQRAASGYQESLQQIVRHLFRLNRYLTETNAQTVWDGNVTALIAAVDAALAAQTTDNYAKIILAQQSLADGKSSVTTWAEIGLHTDGTDDSAAFETWLAGITTPTVLVLPSGRPINLGTGTINVDISKVAFRGSNSVLSGGTIHIFSSVDYYGNEYNWHTLFDSVVFVNSTININGDPATQPTEGKFIFRDGGMKGGSINFQNHAWKIAFDHFHFQGAGINSLGGFIDAGENMIFDKCMIGDGSNITLVNQGDWHFKGCSLDNLTVVIDGNAHVFLTDTHIEMLAGNSNDPFFDVRSGMLSLSQCELVLNGNGQNGQLRTRAYFKVADNLSNGGIFIDNTSVPMSAAYDTTATLGRRLLIEGNGGAHVKRLTTYEGLPQYGFALSACENRLVNGAAEVGDMSGWTLTGSGQWIDDTVYKNRDGASHKIIANQGQGCTFTQEFAVEAGHGLYGQFWQSFNGVAGAKLNTQINYYSITGALLYTDQYRQDTSGFTRNSTMQGRVPSGAVKAAITFYLDNTQGTAGQASMNLDDACINID